MRARTIWLALALTLTVGTARGEAPQRLAYDGGLKGLRQRVLGKKVKEGASTHFYVPGKGGLVLHKTETVEQKANRRITTTLTLRALDERMTVEQAKEALGGVRRNGYLYRVDAAGLKKLELRSELEERVSQRSAHDRYTTRTYHLSDGVIEQWTNGNGTTLRTP